jgi:pimeloyl-ACP methyl ester carboxylesterase
MIDTNGTRLHVRVGGTGSAVVLLHGFGDTGDMWAPIAARLVKDHTVIVPDLRGMGLSDHPDTGYIKKNQAVDIAGVLDQLKISKTDLVTHDIGNRVGYAFATQFSNRVTRWVVIDAPLPGIGDWDNIIKSPLLWHFNFRGPDMGGSAHTTLVRRDGPRSPTRPNFGRTREPSEPRNEAAPERSRPGTKPPRNEAARNEAPAPMNRGTKPRRTACPVVSEVQRVRRKSGHPGS